MKETGAKFAGIGIFRVFLIGPMLSRAGALDRRGKSVGAKQELAGAMAVGVFAFYPR